MDDDGCRAIADDNLTWELTDTFTGRGAKMCGTKMNKVKNCYSSKINKYIAKYKQREKWNKKIMYYSSFFKRNV